VDDASFPAAAAGARETLQSPIHFNGFSDPRQQQQQASSGACMRANMCQLLGISAPISWLQAKAAEEAQQQRSRPQQQRHLALIVAASSSALHHNQQLQEHKLVRTAG
jgi:hypothetical protein